MSDAPDRSPDYPRMTPSGIALRDWFAGQALIAIIWNGGATGDGWTPKDAAELAYEAADAMMKAREK